MRTQPKQVYRFPVLMDVETRSLLRGMARARRITQAEVVRSALWSLYEKDKRETIQGRGDHAE